jgi:transcription initiation factor IIF auxiliary subunit
MDKLAEGLQKLGEDDLLQVVQMVHDHKSADSYTKNDVERTSDQIQKLPSLYKKFHPVVSETDQS